MIVSNPTSGDPVRVRALLWQRADRRSRSPTTRPRPRSSPRLARPRWSGPARGAS